MSRTASRDRAKLTVERWCAIRPSNDCGLFPQVAVVRIGHGKTAPAVVGAGRTDRDDCAGLTNGKRTQNRGVGQAEDRAVRADAKRQGQDGDRGEQRAAAQQSYRMTRVAQEILEPGQAALVAQRVHRLRHPAGTDPCGPDRARPGVAAPSRVLGSQLEVQPQFLFEIAIRPTATERSEEAVDRFTNGGHVTARRLIPDRPGPSG
jgi:hypothetical protein